MIDTIKEQARRIITEANADYISTLERYVLFNSRQTHSTLAMSINQILDGGATVVRKHILESNARFK